ncbi:Ulp1 family isopeptidase [Mesorhizobium caraganae]
MEEDQAVQARQVGVEQHLAEARRLFDQADESPTNPEELQRLDQGLREVLQQWQDEQAASPSFSAEVPEALRPLFDDRSHQPPTNAEELLRVEQGFREVLQQRQDDQAASSSLSNPGMRAGPEDPNRSVSEAFATSGHAGVQAAAPPVLAASQQQIRPSPDALDQGNHLPPQGGIINNEHSTPLLRPAERQRAVDRPQAVAIQQPLSEIGNSGGRMPMQPPMQQLGELPLQGVPVQGTGSEHIGRLHAGAAPSARSEAPPAAIEDSINVSFAVPKDFSHGTQRVPDAMLPFLDRPGPLPDAGQARQAGFEQHVAEPRRADPVASGARASRYHHLSGEHRDLIDRAIAHSQEKYSETTARKYTFALRRLANDLSARGQAIDLRNHKSLVDHVGAFFPKDVDMKSALKALRAYHEPGYSATAGGPAASYPHLSAEHRDVIDKAIDRAAAQQNQSADTLRIYSNALRRLANDLGARGQATDLKNHQSLVDHLDTFFPNDQNIKTALNVLRAYHDPGNAATGWWPAAVPSKADARILEKLSSDSGLALSTRVVYGRLLRRFSEELESRGQTISGLDHNSRTELAEALFPGNKKLRLALQRVHNAEVPEALRPLFDNRAHKPPTNPEELLRLEQGFREVLQQRQDDQGTSSSFSAEVPEALRPLLDDRSHQPPTNPEELLRLDQGLHEVLEQRQGDQATSPSFSAEVPEALRPLFDDRAHQPPTNAEELLRLEQGFREVLQQRQGDQATSPSFSAEVPEALRPLFDDRAHQPPTNADELLRLEQGFREVLQQRQGDQAASSLFSNPGMRAGPEDPNRSVSDAFATSGHAGVQAAAPPVLAASQQQIRPSPDALDQGNHLPPQGDIINNEHSTALFRPAKRQRAVDRPQAVAIQQPLSEIGNSGGRVPMQPPTQQLGELPLEGVPVQGTGSEHIGRLHAEAAPSARAEAPPAAIENSINVSFAVPKGFSHGTQRVPDAMLSFLDRPGPLPDAGQARQAGFEQHVAEPRRAEPVASGARATGYRHLSDEHRDLIDKAIAHAAAQQKYSESTVLKYRYALRRLANDLGARGQATDLKNHQSLVDHLDAFFPKNDDMKRALNVLRAYHEPGYSATVGAPANRYPHLSDEHRDVIDKAIAHAEAQQHHSAPTLRIYSNALRRLANGLGARGQATDLKNHQSLVDHLNTFFPKDTDIRDIRPALNVLRAYHEPGYSATGRWPVTVPSKADAHVLEQVTSDSSLAPSTRVVYGHSLRRFSEALDRRGRTISGLDHDSRIEFAEVLFPGNDYLRLALERVRDAKPASDRIVADALAAAGSGHAGVEAAAPPALAVSQHRPWPDALDQGNLLPPERFIINNEHSTAPLRPAERQGTDNPQSIAIQQPPSEGGRVPMQPPMQQLGGLPLAGVPVQGPGSGSLHAEAAPFARSEAPPAAIENSINVSFAVPKGFSHGTQLVPEAMLSSLYHYGLLPDADKPEWNYEIKGHGYTARRPEEGNDVWLLHRGAIREAGAAAVPARAPGPALPATARLSDTHLGVPLVDLTTSSDAHIEALPSGSSNLPRGAVLGATELLGDEHIQRDYEFLEQQLQQADPALAARTRLVDPSVSHLLRHMEQQDARGTLQSIYDRNAGPSDFLFVPVNDGVGIDRGTHWSLLLVDRRDPERAVAYHYDSIQQNEQRYNDAPARKLATRLDATLVTPDMAQQKNAVDCGVFVVDGTRELVRRLANEERPDQQLPLHLNYLVADRQALQNRLREGRLPHELAASPAEALAAAGSQVQHAALQEQQARQVAPAPLERHLGQTREAEDKLTSTLHRSNRVNSEGVIINTERYTAPLRPAKRQRTDNSQSLAIGRQPSEANTTSIGQASDQARADLMASFRSRERSDAGR